MITPIEPWMGLFVVGFTAHAFAVGFLLGTHYVRSTAAPEPTAWRPDWLQDAIDAYQRSDRRPMSAKEVAGHDWDEGGSDDPADGEDLPGPED